MTNDNRQHKVTDSDKTAITYTHCYKPLFERGEFLNEDCKETINRLYDDSVDLVFTSPPYYNAREYSQYSSVTDYMCEMEQVFLGIKRILKPSRMCVINISPVLVKRKKRSEQSYRIPLPYYFVPMMEKIGFEFLEEELSLNHVLDNEHSSDMRGLGRVPYVGGI